MTEIRNLSHAFDQGRLLRAAIPGLSAGVVCRLSARGQNALMLGAILVIVSATSSLWFLVRDSLKPLMILCGALFLVLAHCVHWWKNFVFRVIGAFVIVRNLSHPVVALRRIPGSVALAACLPFWRCLFPVLLTALFISAGIAERTLDKTSVEKTAGSVFTYRAFPTGNPIQEGSGLNHFSSQCPALPISTCVLWDPQPWSNDLWRMTATPNAAFYVLSTMGFLGLLLRPESGPREMKALVFGSGFPALAWGKIPQPATRFGARMMLLFPAFVAFLGLFRALSTGGPCMKQALAQAAGNR